MISRASAFSVQSTSSGKQIAKKKNSKIDICTEDFIAGVIYFLLHGIRQWEKWLIILDCPSTLNNFRSNMLEIETIYILYCLDSYEN